MAAGVEERGTELCPHVIKKFLLTAEMFIDDCPVLRAILDALGQGDIVLAIFRIKMARYSSKSRGLNPRLFARAELMVYQRICPHLKA